MFLFLLPYAALKAQAPPQAINYQAVARDGAGNIITSAVTVRVSIHSGSASGPLIYQETHNVTPNTYGLFNLAIGQGSAQSGTFSGINWSQGAHFAKIDLNTGGGYTNMGAQQLLSVPYALYSGKASMALNDLSDVNTAGVTPGQVLTWNGSNWSPAADQDNQTLSVSGNTLTISGGNSVTLPSNTYTAGSGITISASNVITAWDDSPTNEIQTLSLSGNTLTLSNGGGSVNLGSALTGFWSLSGNSGTNPASHFLGTTDNQPLSFRTNDYERLRITSDGRVGIGTINPLEALQLGDRWTFHDGGWKTMAYNSFHDGSSWRFIDNGEAAAVMLTNTGDVRFGSASGGIAGGTLSYIYRLSVLNDGLIGVGDIATPLSRLHVYGGSLRITGTSNNNAETGGMLIFDNSGGLGGGTARKVERYSPTHLVANNTNYPIYDDFAVTLSVYRSGSSFDIRLSPKSGYTGVYQWAHASGTNGGTFNCSTPGTYYGTGNSVSPNNLRVFIYSKQDDISVPMYRISLHPISSDKANILIEAYYP